MCALRSEADARFEEARKGEEHDPRPRALGARPGPAPRCASGSTLPRLHEATSSLAGRVTFQELARSLSLSSAANCPMRS
jgi:hypothetical protein